jgi:hypothetical protein
MSSASSRSKCSVGGRLDYFAQVFARIDAIDGQPIMTIFDPPSSPNLNTQTMGQEVDNLTADRETINTQVRGITASPCCFLGHW